MSDKQSLTCAPGRLDGVEQGEWVCMSVEPAWWQRLLGIQNASKTRIVSSITGDTCTITHPLIWRWRQVTARVKFAFAMARIRQRRRPSKEGSE